MEPHDQQLCVSSGTGLVLIAVRDDFVIAFQFFCTKLTGAKTQPTLSGGANGSLAEAHALHSSGGERSSAAAGLRRLRVYEYESLLHQRFLVIQDHAVQVDERFRIDKDADIAELKNAVAFARLRIEADVIAQAGTSAALHTKAQAALLGRNAFLGHRDADFRDRLLGDRDALGGGLWRRVFDSSRHSEPGCELRALRSSKTCMLEARGSKLRTTLL